MEKYVKYGKSAFTILNYPHFCLMHDMGYISLEGHALQEEASEYITALL
jgi:hypothetical protein